MKNYNNARVKQSLFAVDAMTLMHGDIRDDCLVKNQIHHGLTDSLDWVLSHWAHFTVLRFIFACIMFIVVYCVHV